MSEHSIDRRNFLKLLGAGTASLGAGFVAPTIVGKTENGFLLESETEYGGFLIEQLNNAENPNPYDPDVLERMSEKFTVFSRNDWDPARADRPELTENLTGERLVEKEGKVIPTGTVSLTGKLTITAK